MNRLRLPLTLLAVGAACASGPKPVAAHEDLEIAVAAAPGDGGRRVIAAPADAVDCGVEPTGRDVGELTAGDVGSIVVVEGQLHLGMTICSQMKCEIPCCNRCGAALVLGGDAEGKGGLHLATQGGSSISCGGSECDFTCPGMAPGNTYRVTGTLERASDGRFALDVKSLCRRVAEEQPAAPAEEPAEQP
ncbi:MAG: hypothetical protein ACK4N5_07370 [Myxococcales bacterium]